MIQGDGIDRTMVDSILNALIQYKFSPDNLAFGSGGGLLRKHDRDSKQFAFKYSHAVVNGEERDIWKDPITSHSKKSKRGVLALINEETIHTVRVEDYPHAENMLVSVFEDGKILKEYSFDEIRERAEIV